MRWSFNVDMVVLEQIYYVGQTIAAAVILISLIFINIQIRQNSQNIRADVTFRHQQSMKDLLQSVIDDPAMASIFRRVMYTDERLDEVESLRFLSWIESVLMGMEAAYFLERDEMMSEGLQGRWEKTILWYFQRKFVRAYWVNDARSRFAPEFVAYLESMLGSHGIEFSKAVDAA